MSSPMAGVAVVNAIVFGVYGNLQRQLNNSEALSSHFLAGAAAGFVQSFVCSPMELVKTRLQVQRNNAYTGPLNCFIQVPMSLFIIQNIGYFIVKNIKIFPLLAMRILKTSACKIYIFSWTICGTEGGKVASVTIRPTTYNKVQDHLYQRWPTQMLLRNSVCTRE